VTSSNFPRFDRKTQTGGAIAWERLDEAIPAINRVFHDSARPSHLRLPVLERASNV
jgi:predicted acyl esterase